MFLTYFSRFIKQKYMYVLCLMGISVVCVYTFFTFFYLDSLFNLSINWPINTLLIENLAFASIKWLSYVKL